MIIKIKYLCNVKTTFSLSWACLVSDSLVASLPVESSSTNTFCTPLLSDWNQYPGN